jgi:hypothetical protein
MGSQGGETTGETLRLLSVQAPSLTRLCKFVQAQSVADRCGAETYSEDEVGEALSRLNLTHVIRKGDVFELVMQWNSTEPLHCCKSAPPPSLPPPARSAVWLYCKNGDLAESVIRIYRYLTYGLIVYVEAERQEPHTVLSGRSSVAGVENEQIKLLVLKELNI